MAVGEVGPELPQFRDTALGVAALLEKPEEFIDDNAANRQSGLRVLADFAVQKTADGALLQACDRKHASGFS